MNHLAVVSAVAPGYAPAGAALVSASVLEPDRYDRADLEGRVRRQLARWFGADVGTWRHLKTYHIPHALPPQDPPTLAEPERPVRLAPGLYVCGDHRDQASIQGAMVSGRRAGDQVADEIAASARGGG